MTDTYKLLISGELVQQTAFSTDGGDSDSPLDMPLAVNGNGEYTLRGSSLAGAFIATAKRLFPDLSPAICEGTPGEQLQRERGKDQKTLPRHHESLWVFHNAHPINAGCSESEVRDHVAISQKTGAARHTAKFDTEILPAGTRWRFIMEVDQYREDDTNPAQADAIALHVAEQWRQGCWLGRDVARGLGWMTLENLKVHQLKPAHVSNWPNAEIAPFDALEQLPGDAQLQPDARKALAEKATPGPIHQLHGTFTITVGEGANGYGLDMLSVGGNNGDWRLPGEPPGGRDFLEQHKQKLIKPLGQGEDHYLSFSQSTNNKPDFNLAVTCIDGKHQPLIPGSALRGPLRHALSWLLRRRGEAVWEPGETLDDHTNDLPLILFGSTRESARLLIGDAMPKNDDWEMVVLEMHAGDEFTGGVYGSGKFDRTALTKGRFQAPWHLEADSQEELEELIEGLRQLDTLTKSRRIALGGGQWKGLGWVRIDIAGLPGKEESND